MVRADGGARADARYRVQGPIPGTLDDFCSWTISRGTELTEQTCNMILSWKQGPTGRGFQLRDGSGSGIGKNISGRIGYGSGTGIFSMYLNNRVLSGSANLDRVFFGYFPTSYLFHGT